MFGRRTRRKQRKSSRQDKTFTNSVAEEGNTLETGEKQRSNIF
jgi:hypothetical protein